MRSSHHQIWRNHNFLVMHRDAELPDRCIRTNLPANGQRFTARLYWHPPAIYLFLLMNILVYAIAALIVRKQFVIRCSISRQALDRRKQGKIMLCSGCLLGLCLCFGAVDTDPGSAEFAWLFFGGALLFVFSLLIGVARSTIVRIQKIEGDYIWLTGVSPEFLSELPDWRTKS
ncbi:hypothetical protein IQ266_19160 [filamentous cyanobacterium LEGE 11480]|uniref:Uncharacterized protein n=1 Tax=Romeriopsis navalis LEGE 11480 TaxID=2777977 RepID=A0A928VQF8_9CYAN|nr:hypothetical protein [Romeriopsis navalis]MBE9031857.1 hypothetical protein [Romeriopsis navalis LEGE 11480]